MLTVCAIELKWKREVTTANENWFCTPSWYYKRATSLIRNACTGIKFYWRFIAIRWNNKHMVNMKWINFLYSSKHMAGIYYKTDSSRWRWERLLLLYIELKVFLIRAERQQKIKRSMNKFHIELPMLYLPWSFEIYIKHSSPVDYYLLCDVDDEPLFDIFALAFLSSGYLHLNSIQVWFILEILAF